MGKLKLANSLMREKKYHEAIKLYKEILVEQPSFDFIQTNIQLCEFKIHTPPIHDRSISLADTGTRYVVNGPKIGDEIKKLFEISHSDKHLINGYSETKRSASELLLNGDLKQVSVVIPVYNRSKILGMTLAGIVHQTYPKNLIEVIVVDDGSKEDTIKTIRSFEEYLDISYYWQKDLGYRPGQARTAGMRLSKYSNIITLDCDMLPTRDLVAEYMYVLNRKQTSVLVGPRNYVCTDHLMVDDLIASPYWIDTLPEIITNNNVATGKYMGKKTVDWRHAFYRRTNFLKNSIFPFIAFASGNVAYPKTAFDITGGYDEEFEKWGGEDTEFGYRLFTSGYHIEPVMGALALHQDPPGGDNEVDRASGYVETKAIMREKCPLFSREYEDGRSYKIPKYAFMNATQVSDTDFAALVKSWNYSDCTIINKDVAQKIMSDEMTVNELNEFLKINQSPFLIKINDAIKDSVPKTMDLLLKNLDKDLATILFEFTSVYMDAVDILWRGDLSKIVNFQRA